MTLVLHASHHTAHSISAACLALAGLGCTTGAWAQANGVGVGPSAPLAPASGQMVAPWLMQPAVVAPAAAPAPPDLRSVVRYPQNAAATPRRLNPQEREVLRRQLSPPLLTTPRNVAVVPMMAGSAAYSAP